MNILLWNKLLDKISNLCHNTYSTGKMTMKTYNIQINEYQRRMIETALMLLPVEARPPLMLDDMNELTDSPEEEFDILFEMFCDLQHCEDPDLCNGFCL
jgi:hypothetical protein